MIKDDLWSSLLSILFYGLLLVTHLAILPPGAKWVTKTVLALYVPKGGKKINWIGASVLSLWTQALFCALLYLCFISESL